MKKKKYDAKSKEETLPTNIQTKWVNILVESAEDESIKSPTGQKEAA